MKTPWPLVGGCVSGGNNYLPAPDSTWGTGGGPIRSGVAGKPRNDAAEKESGMRRLQTRFAGLVPIGVLPLFLTYGVAFSQEPVPTSTGPPPLFTSEDPIEFTLEADFQQLKRALREKLTQALDKMP